MDLGTTNWKAVAYRLDGHPVASANLPAPARRDREGEHFHPDRAWAAFAALTRSLSRRLGARRRHLAALGLSSLAETGVPLDGQGRWVYPAILWHDPRTMPQRDRFFRRHDPRDISRLTGLTTHHIFTLFKLQWLRERHPSAFRRMAKWLWLPDFMTWKMTGEQATDYSIASRSMLFDVRARRWDSSLLRQAAMSPAHLPALVPSSTIVGLLTREAARATGLPEGLPVAAGGHDHICGAFGAGATAEGVVLDSIGTAESLFVTLDAVPKHPWPGVTVGCHVAAGKYYAKGGLFSASATLEWTLKQLGLPQRYDQLIRLARQAPEGPTGLLYLPHLWGSSTLQGDPASRAALVGLSGRHTGPHVIRATLEGLSYEIALMLEQLERRLRLKAREIRVIGGGSKNPAWMAVKAQVFGRPLKIARHPDLVTLGAALLAGLGVGAYSDEAALRRRLRLRWITLRPGSRLVRSYRPWLARYARLYPALQGLGVPPTLGAP